MSFFGLTAFGPESLVKSTLVNSNGFTLFFDDDYKRAFDSMVRGRSKPIIYVKEYHELMTKTMGFPPLDEEVDFFVKHCGKSNPDDTLTWEEILSTLNVIRNELNETAKKSVKYHSYQKYYDDTFKHIRKETENPTVFKSPATAGMNFGFYKFETHDLNNIHHPKKKCAETKYAESVIMTKFLN